MNLESLKNKTVKQENKEQLRITTTLLLLFCKSGEKKDVKPN